jgi:hypothetical protein
VNGEEGEQFVTTTDRLNDGFRAQLPLVFRSWSQSIFSGVRIFTCETTLKRSTQKVLIIERIFREGWNDSSADLEGRLMR